MKKMFVGMLLCLLVLPTILAADPSFTIRQGQDTTISVPVFFSDNQKADATISCAVTVRDPTQEIILSDSAMTFDPSGHYNFSFTAVQLDELGRHPSSIRCDNAVDFGFSSFVIDVTADGFPPEVFPFQFSILILAFLMIFIGIYSDRLRILKHTGAILAMIMGLLTLWPGYSYINHSTLKGLALGSIAIGLGFYFLIEDSFSRDDQQEGYESQGIFD